MTTHTPESITDTYKQRTEKLTQLKNRGINPYPKNFTRESSIDKILRTYFPNSKTCETKKIRAAGRVMSKRPMGKAGFLLITDQNSSIQIYSNDKLLDDENFFIFKSIDIGDIVGIEGVTFRTKTNEASIKANSITILSKNLSPIPIVKKKEGHLYDTFSDTETRYRKRYLDLAVNPEVRQNFIRRSQIIRLIREFFINHNFIEVETPMLQSIPSGAAAKPFKTYHNSLGIPLYLRIAPELYLKRLIVGGFEKIFEINRNFRNEGISAKHNPEFTMIELYQAYSDYKVMMKLTQELFEHIALKIHGDLKIPYGEHIINLEKPWKQITYLESIKEKTNIDFMPFLSQEKPSWDKAKNLVQDLKLNLTHTHTFWEVVDEVFSHCVEPTLIQPTLITHYPKAISPLAKSSSEHECLVERFEPYITGREMGNAFSELNDPIEQEKRFTIQTDMKEQGAEETVLLDEDYIEALRVGMPPTSGLGLGIDRMIMLFNNHPSIKDTIFFPTLRPQ